MVEPKTKRPRAMARPEEMRGLSRAVLLEAALTRTCIQVDLSDGTVRVQIVPSDIDHLVEIVTKTDINTQTRRNLKWLSAAIDIRSESPNFSDITTDRRRGTKYNGARTQIQSAQNQSVYVLLWAHNFIRTKSTVHAYAYEVFTDSLHSHFFTY